VSAISNADGRVDQWWSFPDPTKLECPVVESDADGDGRPDTRQDVCKERDAQQAAAAAAANPRSLLRPPRKFFDSCCSVFCSCGCAVTGGCRGLRFWRSQMNASGLHLALATVLGLCLALGCGSSRRKPSSDPKAEHSSKGFSKDDKARCEWNNRPDREVSEAPLPAP